MQLCSQQARKQADQLRSLLFALQVIEQDQFLLLLLIQDNLIWQGLFGYPINGRKQELG
jgi:hypothetical protein